jgi:hypothetical protein
MNTTAAAAADAADSEQTLPLVLLVFIPIVALWRQKS